MEGADGFDGVKQLAEKYRAFNGVLPSTVLPLDAVTRSASGLDPHTSVANARLQANRVARENAISVQKVNELINKATDRRFVGLFGEDAVNVLKLNLSLQELMRR